MRKPKIELDILDNNRISGQEKYEYKSESLEKMGKVFRLVEKQIKKNLDNRLKEYLFAHKNKLEVGKHILVFNPTRRVGEASQLKRGRSLPSKLNKKMNKICFEIESLAWANPKFTIVWSISQIKPYHGPTEFKKANSVKTKTISCQNTSLRLLKKTNR